MSRSSTSSTSNSTMSSVTSYSLDPKTNQNPLQHLKRADWKVNYSLFSNIKDFQKCYELKQVLTNKQDYKVIKIKSRDDPSQYEIVKIYDTNGDMPKFYKYVKLIQTAALSEHGKMYYNPKTKKCFIREPMYSASLETQIQTKTIPNMSENAVKFMIRDVLYQIWLIHNCGYVYGDVTPSNIVKREFSDDIRDGWKLIDFQSMRKHKSKGSYVGTAGWTAPEMQWNSDRNRYAYASDIFSLGLLILFALFGQTPVEITNEEKTKYGQNGGLFSGNDSKNRSESIQMRFKTDLEQKMCKNWHENRLLKSENVIKNYLIGLYFHGQISEDLFQLLYVGMLVYDPSKRVSCQQIYDSKWFIDVRRYENKTKLRIRV